MINDMKEIVGIIFMIVVGITIMVALSEIPNRVASSFANLGITILILAGLAGVITIIMKYFKP